MSTDDKVLLTELTVRRSKAGNEYLSGLLGHSRVVGFKGEPDREGNEVWRIFVAQRQVRGRRAHDGDGRMQPTGARSSRREHERAQATQAPIDPDFNDSIEDIGR